MTPRTLICGLVLVGATALITSRVVSQQGGDQPPATPDAPQMPDMAQMAEMMKKYQESMTPGPQHKRLDDFVGDWDLTLRMYMMGPGAPPTETKGTSTVKWVLDGRFLLEEMKAEMIMPDANMQPKPVPYAGMGLTGYDNFKNMYTGCWAQTASTELFHFTGMAPPGTKTWTFYGAMDEAMLNVYGRTVKMVNRIIDNDKHVFEMYDLHAGDGYKVFEIEYNRKK